MSWDLAIVGASEIFDGEGVLALEQPVIGIRDGYFSFIGEAADAADAGLSNSTQRIEVPGRLVTPGLVDPHTHIVFGGERSEEYAMRAAGKPYLEIARAGGGIKSTMRATRAATFDSLVQSGLERLDRLLSFGVTTAEVKSGYGLDLDSELKILRVIRALNRQHAIELVPTFLGAHTIPPEYLERRAAYVELVIDEMLPAVAAEGLAEFCDVFVEDGAFTVDEATEIFAQAKTLGLKSKLHADQLSCTNGAELAAAVGATSADHLEHMSDAGIAAMAAAQTVAVLLPGASLFLNQAKDPPVRRLIESGVPIALATDCNPGTCMTENLLLMLTLGMSRYGLSPVEALSAVTSGAALALDRASTAGSIQVGRQADLAIFNVDSITKLPYHFGVPHTDTVLKAGEVVYGRLS